jgi:antitoxin VapB
MDTAKVFTNGRSQAVRLPRAYRFEDDEVCITRVDDMVILYPRRKGWDLLARGIERFTGDFMADRDQPAEIDKRQEL